LKTVPDRHMIAMER